MQRINDKLKSLCKFCSSNLDKPCAWISLGNEYCDRIMDIQNELNNRIPRKDIEDMGKKINSELAMCRNYKANQIVIKKYFERLLNKE